MSGEDAPPAPPAPSPLGPDRLQQARADRAEQKAKEHKNKRQPCRACKPWFLPSHDCTVGTALAFCVYVTNEVDRDASMLQAHTVHIHAQAHDVHTHAHAHTRACARILTHAHALPGVMPTGICAGMAKI